MWGKSDETREVVTGRAAGTGGGAGSAPGTGGGAGPAPTVTANRACVLMADVSMDKVIPADLLEENKDNAALIAEKNINIEMKAGKVGLGLGSQTINSTYLHSRRVSEVFHMQS